MSTGTGSGTIASTESFIPTSAVSICNMALGHLGARPINQIDEESQEARNCKIFWDNTRDSVLRGYNWNFADAKVLGASVDVPTVDDDLWTYAYTYPNLAVLIRKVTVDGSDEAVDFKVIVDTEDSGNKRTLILTNAETAAIHYTARIETTTLWDPAFVNAMAYAMAAKLAVPITKNPEIAKFMEIKYQEAMPVAKRDDFKENKSDPSVPDPWETARLEG